MIGTTLLTRLLELYPEKMAQLKKAQDTTFNLTSSDGCCLTVEVYDNDIARYIIEGTRCQVAICFNATTLELCRKPYKAKSWFAKVKNTISFNDIINNERA